MLKLGQKIGAPAGPFEYRGGGGANGYLGNAQMNREFLWWGFPKLMNKFKKKIIMDNYGLPPWG